MPERGIKQEPGIYLRTPFSVTPADRSARVGDRLESVHVNPLRDRTDTPPKRATFPARYSRLSFLFFAMYIDSIYWGSLSGRTAPPVERCPVGNCTYLFSPNLFLQCCSLQRAMQKRSDTNHNEVISAEDVHTSERTTSSDLYSQLWGNHNMPNMPNIPRFLRSE